MVLLLPVQHKACDIPQVRHAAFIPHPFMVNLPRKAPLYNSKHTADKAYHLQRHFQGTSVLCADHKKRDIGCKLFRSPDSQYLKHFFLCKRSDHVLNLKILVHDFRVIRYLRQSCKFLVNITINKLRHGQIDIFVQGIVQNSFRIPHNIIGHVHLLYRRVHKDFFKTVKFLAAFSFEDFFYAA